VRLQAGLWVLGAGSRGGRDPAAVPCCSGGVQARRRLPASAAAAPRRQDQIHNSADDRSFPRTVCSLDCILQGWDLSAAHVKKPDGPDSYGAQASVTCTASGRGTQSTQRSNWTAQSPGGFNSDARRPVSMCTVAATALRPRRDAPRPASMPQPGGGAERGQMQLAARKATGGAGRPAAQREARARWSGWGSSSWGASRRLFGTGRFGNSRRAVYCTKAANGSMAVKMGKRGAGGRPAAPQTRRGALS
jgi:hypothetical protein